MKKIIILLFSLLLCTQVFAEPYKEFVVIGDSLSDNGNLYDALFKIIPKSPPYFKGRFTNGPTWAENVGKFYFDKYNINYRVIAYGGATAILHNPAHDKFVAPITLDGEVYKYLMESLLTDKSDVLYAIWIGANDYLYDEQPDTDALVNDVVGKISWALITLKNNGAKHFVVLNLPDLSRTPFAKSHHNENRLHELSLKHNQKLFDAINKFQHENKDIQISMINIFDIFNEFLDDTEKFNKTYNINITNTVEACWKGGMTVAHAEKPVNQLILNSPSLLVAYNNGKAYEKGLTPCSNASEYIFWDELHPTDTVHHVLAQIFVKTVGALSS